jgi:hypothetical protein
MVNASPKLVGAVTLTNFAAMNTDSFPAKGQGTKRVENEIESK